MIRLALSVQGADAFAGLPASRTLRRWVTAALERNAQLTLRFVSAREGRRLNRQYRGKDHATNVLTFDYEQGPQTHADIVICVPVVQREARAQRKTLRDHLAHLIIHGTLHAQGFDHLRSSDARRMQLREIELLDALGIPNPYDAG
jgi:probable rRNA maturation factor